MIEISSQDVDSVFGDNFVANNGRYWHSTNQKEYAPQTVRSDRPLPISALFFWGLQQEGAKSEYYEIVRALQNYIRVNCGGWSIKHHGNRFTFEYYFVTNPDKLAEMAGQEIPGVRLPGDEADLNFFLRFEQLYFSQAPQRIDQRQFGLVGERFWSLHFDLTDQLFRDRRVPEYTFGTQYSGPPQLPRRPGPWEGYVWHRRDMELAAEQHGYVVDPTAHQPEMLTFIDEAVKMAWPVEPRPDPWEFLVPWLFEHTRDNHRLLGLTRKELKKKGGLGVYYRLDYPTFMRFLEEFDYPPSYVRKVADHEAEMGHLHYDVALAYKVADGKTSPARSALYGTV